MYDIKEMFACELHHQCLQTVTAQLLDPNPTKSANKANYAVYTFILWAKSLLLDK